MLELKSDDFVVGVANLRNITGRNSVGACVTEGMRELHATFPATNVGNFVNI